MTQATAVGGSQLAGQHRHPEQPSAALKAAISRSDKSMKKLASALTPQVRASMIDGLLNQRSDQYHALFDLWQVNQPVRDEVMAIVREREMQLSNHRHNLFANGRASTKVYVANKLFDESLSELQLTKLLGKARFEEFSRLESQMFQAEHPNIGRRKTDG